MPAYNQQQFVNVVGAQDWIPVVLLNAEKPTAGASQQAAIEPNFSGQRNISFLFKSPAGVGAGVFEIQEADEDVDASYTSVAFGGTNPGQVTSASFVSPAPSKSAKVTLTLRTRFVRIFTAAAPDNAVTVEVSG